MFLRSSFTPPLLLSPSPLPASRSHYRRSGSVTVTCHDRVFYHVGIYLMRVSAGLCHTKCMVDLEGKRKWEVGGRERKK